MVEAAEGGTYSHRRQRPWGLSSPWRLRWPRHLRLVLVSSAPEVGVDVKSSLVWHVQQAHAHCYRSPDLLLLAHLLAKQILPGQNGQRHIHGRRVCCRKVSRLARFPSLVRTRHPLTAGENVVPYRYIDGNAAVPWQLEETAFDPDEEHTGR